MTPDFDAADPGTPECTWLLDPRWDGVPVSSPEAVLAGCDSLLVLAAHPDDESLGAGGLVAAAARAGHPVDVVVATAGEGSHPGASAWTREDLAVARREECRRAVDALTGGAGRLHELGLPDGGLVGREAEITAALTPFVRPGTLVLAPWRGDGHPDHEVVGRAAESLGARAWHYPVWAWHWGAGDNLPWDRLRQVPLDADLLAAKRAGVDAHASQTTPLGPGAGDAALLAPHVRARFDRLVETYVVPKGDPAPPGRPGGQRAETFDALLGEGDPWDFDGWYERRKRAVTLAALQRERYRRVLDIGCATGRLTADLARRADESVGVDVSAAALARAAEHLDDTSARWVHGELPEVLESVTGDPFDLVVLSEVGYFLTADEWLTTLRGARRLLADDGEMLLCHWRHPSADLALDGTLVHDQALAALDLPVRVRYEDEDVVLAVLGGTPPTPRTAR